MVWGAFDVRLSVAVMVVVMVVCPLGNGRESGEDRVIG